MLDRTSSNDGQEENSSSESGSGKCGKSDQGSVDNILSRLIVYFNQAYNTMSVQKRGFVDNTRNSNNNEHATEENQNQRKILESNLYWFCERSFGLANSLWKKSVSNHVSHPSLYPFIYLIIHINVFI